ncbi:MAG TPA: hypothetical protein VK559_10940 [Ferruginibacter sp.]|nr:hypothetical protein [Ferruginibacter sp.]
MNSTLRRFFIKTFSWEYWPVWVVYFPTGFYFTYLSIKAGSFFFFSAANPTIETGGMFFESKWKIFKLIPKEYYPTTILIEEKDDMVFIEQQLQDLAIGFPLIAKPDRGGRGWGVKKICSLNELALYKSKVLIPFLIQAYADYPIELSIFYYRDPNNEKGIITSVTLKEMLTIIGDGHSTVDQLIKKNDRAFLQYDKLKRQNSIDLNKILPAGEEETIVPYGNHVLGATFLDYNHIIDEQLTHTVDRISKSIDGFYFGRYDLRCNSIEELKMGANFSILELNGAGAEPAHIYEPGFPFFKGQAVLFKHFNMLYKAAKANNKKGIPYMSYKDFKDMQLLEKTYRQKVTLS